MAWSFADALGQGEATERLLGEIARGRLAHAYLFEGPAGTGKHTLARGLIGYLLCTGRASGDRASCGVCHSCRMLVGGGHPDCLELPRGAPELRIGRFLDRQGGKEPVEHQPLLPFLRMRPTESDMRVALVPDAERMRGEAANAFLKTLEEPPGGSLIIMTTSARDRLPATIVSRSRRIGVKPLESDALVAELERRGVAFGQDAVDLAEAAEGALGAALTLAGGETLALWRWLESEAFLNPSAGSARRLADNWLAYGDASGDNAGKRQNALAALNLSALALRRGMRKGRHPGKTAAALAVLWEAGDQILKNVKPDLVLLAAAFEVAARLR